MSSSRARPRASSPHGYQSTGLSLCCSRYGLVSPASRLLIHPAYFSSFAGQRKWIEIGLNPGPDLAFPCGNDYGPSMPGDQLPIADESSIEAVLQKLEVGDREIVRGALEKAEKTEAELRYLADHDSLTGLLDRRRFRSELDGYVSFTARYGGKGAVMIIDIDGLKAVNDGFGHHAGDNLIRQIAKILRERVRATDIVARLSGDELAVLMPQTDTEGALHLGEDLRSQVAENARPGPEDEPVTISVGITMFGSGELAGSAEAVLIAADQAMYRAKEEGRNQISLFSEPGEAQTPPRRRQTTTARIRDALTHGRLSPHSQPIRSLASGGIERSAAPMKAEDGELLPASAFIGAAERS